MTQITSQTILDARRGNREAVVDVLSVYYKPVWRIATGLTGRADAGRGALQYIMQRSLRAMSKWSDDEAPSRWFHHHTVLLARELADRDPRVTEDVLIVDAQNSDPLYVAFVRALRALPMQQREAFLLTHGEKLTSRTVAIAMDCSMVAAEQHLRKARLPLEQLAGSEYPLLLARLAARYGNLEPAEDLTLTDIRNRVRKYILPYIIKRTSKIVFTIVLLIAIVWAGWWAYQIVSHSMPH